MLSSITKHPLYDTVLSSDKLRQRAADSEVNQSAREGDKHHGTRRNDRNMHYTCTIYHNFLDRACKFKRAPTHARGINALRGQVPGQQITAFVDVLITDIYCMLDMKAT
jgi:hypothetical protein